ncbi:hypothetical protein SAMN05444008_103101 [Cnuella takakiae]|uniref:Uncharacterized protein n=1 Tax=Cnuella takakiae TaxID=1302690 RepID=A0A1M4WQ87_9BACT|nr:hypothetical protein [Cnuella takakiae]SHE83337.1 hypothetical protein SAMN05444008_103101 [Cnuella takakiae]
MALLFGAPFSFVYSRYSIKCYNSIGGRIAKRQQGYDSLDSSRR